MSHNQTYTAKAHRSRSRDWHVSDVMAYNSNSCRLDDVSILYQTSKQVTAVNSKHQLNCVEVGLLYESEWIRKGKGRYLL